MNVSKQTAIVALVSLMVGIAAAFIGMSLIKEKPVGERSLVSDPFPPFGKDCEVQISAAQDKAMKKNRGLYQRSYEFTENWFNNEGRLPLWKKLLLPLKDQPLQYLEVGVFEGGSALWMLENVLVNPKSRLTAIDIYLQPPYVRNVKRSGQCSRVRNLWGPSSRWLPLLPKNHFDVIYVDGSHLAADVMVDAVHSFELLKTGGLIIFDDYAWVMNWSADMRPQIAIDAFITSYRNQLEIVHRGYQLVVRKRLHPCPKNTHRASPVGQYCYHWVKGLLLRPSDWRPVKISKEEQEMIATLARSPRFSEVGLRVSPELAANPTFRALHKRLKLNVPLPSTTEAPAPKPIPGPKPVKSLKAKK